MALFMNSYSGNDVELCRTTNSRAGERTAEMLLEQQIPFVKNIKRIPFFKREEYDGAERIWVISINPRRYGQARRAIDTLDISCRKKLVLSNY